MRIESSPLSCEFFPPIPKELGPMGLEKALAMKFDTCQIGQRMSLLVHNTSNEPRTFKGGIWGVYIAP